MTGLSLYVIATEHRQMVERLMDTQDDSQAIADTIEAESYPLEIKAQNVAYAIKTLDANADAKEAVAKEILARAKAERTRAAHIKEYLKTCMEIAGIKKVECPHFALTIKSNPPSVDIFEEKLIPAEYLKTLEPPPPQPDKAAIKEAIKDGKEVPGAMLAQGTRLEIK